MKNFIIFTRKELVESWKTYRTVVLGAVLLLFAISSPLLAKYTPQLLNSLMSSEDMAAAGLNFVMPEPTYMDSFAQFYKNITQIPFPVVVFIAASLIAGERTRGTYIIPFSQGLGRGTMITAKFAGISIVWTICYFLSVLVSIGYTAVLFEGAHYGEYMLGCTAIWIYSEVMIAVALLCSALLKNTLISTIVAFVAWFALMGTAFIPKINEVTPAYLSNVFGEIITKSKSFSDLIPAVICSVVVAAAALVGSQLLFKRQEI